MASLLGTGPSFPLNLSNSKGLAYVSDIEKVNQSLFILFETPIGSRLMLPGYGSDIHRYVFDPLDNVLLEKLRYTIKEDIRKWEPRISSVHIDFLSNQHDIDNSTLYISITYTLLNTDVAHNYVYPYKLESYDATKANNQ